MFTKFFISRPIFASVLSAVVLLAGAISLPTLPVAHYPNITPPQVSVNAEYIGANAGVGYRIQYSEAQLDASGVFGGLVVLMALVFVVDTVIRRIQRRLIAWKPQSL